MAAREYFTESHNIFRQSVRKLVSDRIIPNIENWDEQGSFPRELYTEAAQQGWLGLGFDEEYGGAPGDVFYSIVLTEELIRAGSLGLPASLLSHGIALPPIALFGNEEQKRRFIPDVLAGKKICALGITEPNAGSDVASLQTRAVRDGDCYVVNGSKMFITSGVRADFVTTAVRTGGPGYEGISLLVVESDTPGFTARALKKMGWWCSDTAEIFFDDCRVPVANLIGQENQGFGYIMGNFQAERLSLAVMCVAAAQVAFDATLEHVKTRQAFGKPLIASQVIRHKLVDMATRIDAAREYTYRVADLFQSGTNCVRQVSMAKNVAVECCDFVANEAVQLHGGMGYMRGTVAERIYRDSRVMGIGGGTNEIMKEIISKLILT